MAMLYEWWQRDRSTHEERKQSGEPRTRPSLQPCPTPAEPGPASGTDVPDLRAVLLELVADRARLRRNRSLFQKEAERFASVLGPLPDWLVEMYNLTPPRRRDIALYWAMRLRLTQERSEGKLRWLDAAETGRHWLTRPAGEQYAFLYQQLRDTHSREAAENYWGHEFDDGWFLGSPVSSLPVAAPGRRSEDVWGVRLTKEQRQLLREALYAAFAELPLGVYHRFDNFVSYVCFGPHNPLLLGRHPDQVRVRMAGRILLPRYEPLFATGRRLLGQLVSNRLIPLGCLQASRDADGELMIARLPRLDVYFGRTAVTETEETQPAPVVVVQPDFSVVVIGLDQAPLAELLPFCERDRERSSAGAATLRLTRASVVRGVITGLARMEILERLQRHSRTPLPDNVVHEVGEWAGWVRRVSTESATLLRCPDAAAAERLVCVLGRNAERLNETTVAVAADDLSDAAHRKLLEQGIVIERFADETNEPEE